MRSIREMESAWVKINGRNFALIEYRVLDNLVKTPKRGSEQTGRGEHNKIER